MTRNYRPAAMRASDADRDAVVSDLSEHFQAGRLTAAELDERTGLALAARTLWRAHGAYRRPSRPAARSPPTHPRHRQAAAADRAHRTSDDRRAGRPRDRGCRTGYCGPRRVGPDLAGPARAGHPAP